MKNDFFSGLEPSPCPQHPAGGVGVGGGAILGVGLGGHAVVFVKGMVPSLESALPRLRRGFYFAQPRRAVTGFRYRSVPLSETKEPSLCLQFWVMHELILQGIQRQERIGTEVAFT